MRNDGVERAAQRFERAFARIHAERMVDFPLSNPRITVKAMEFHPFGERILGIMVTPWSMNLVIVRERGEELPVPGETCVEVFPSGRYEFIVGEEDSIGRYLMCSLFSPMFEFEDQAAAEATAEAVMVELMKAENTCEAAAPGAGAHRGAVQDAPQGGEGTPLLQRRADRRTVLRLGLGGRRCSK